MDEERFSRRIAAAIVRQRHDRPIETSAELAELIRGAVPSIAQRTADRSGHTDFSGPADRSQRRIEIAGDRPAAHPDCLRRGARMAVISFHSLEDRRVKEGFLADQPAADIDPAAGPAGRPGNRGESTVAQRQAARRGENAIGCVLADVIFINV